MAKLAIIVLLAINIPVLFLSSEIFLTCASSSLHCSYWRPARRSFAEAGAAGYLAYSVISS
jgi:hypothetical protein